jgi:hypothetical protein
MDLLEADDHLLGQCEGDDPAPATKLRWPTPLASASVCAHSCRDQNRTPIPTPARFTLIPSDVNTRPYRY